MLIAIMEIVIVGGATASIVLLILHWKELKKKFFGKD